MIIICVVTSSSYVYIWYILHNEPLFLPVDIQRNQCPCRFFNPIKRYDTRSVVIVIVVIVVAVVVVVAAVVAAVVVVVFTLSRPFYPASSARPGSVLVLILETYSYLFCRGVWRSVTAGDRVILMCAGWTTFTPHKGNNRTMSRFL